MKNTTLFSAIIAFLFSFSSLIAESSSIHEHGYWCGDVSKAHVTDHYLANGLVQFFKKEGAASVVDLGCGMGEYVRTLLDNQISCVGYDGNPDTFQLTGGIGHVIDLSEPIDLGKKFDWVLSLEVGEHLPKKFETIFIENLHRHNIHGIVLSWALKGQGGYGHFNEQSNDYIKNIMATYGYLNDVGAENQLRECSFLPWFKNTIMVFRKVVKT